MEITNKQVRYELTFNDSLNLEIEIRREKSNGWREVARETQSPADEGRPIMVVVDYEPIESKREIDKVRIERNGLIESDLALYGFAWIRISYNNHYQNKGAILKERFDPALIRIQQPK